MSVPRSLLLSAIVTITVVVGAFFPGGVPFWWSVVIALPVGAAVMIACLLAGVFDVDWTPEPEQPSAGVCLQASTLADRLAGAADDQRRFATRIQPRLRRLALDRLRRKEGIDDLADPMARDLLGADLHDLITTPDGRLPPPKTFVAMVRRLEEP
jgi:cell division protein FtsW (lipid II flippase)